jgi:ATP-dependent DNA helicase RecQ
MQQLLLLTSPPASGKTFWIESFAQALSTPSLLVISPLRALADECLDKWQGRIQVMTPEEWLYKGTAAEIVILDEFHLYFYWGDSFRERMWEAFYGLCCDCRLAVLLTATLSASMTREIAGYSNNFEEILWCDQGNQQLRFQPATYIQAPSAHWLQQLMLQKIKGNSEVHLVFCPYRQQVKQLGLKLEQQGYRVWTCIGGEAGHMREKMLEPVLPDFIVATTVLSHGVNLPQISSIYFLYTIRNMDFWLQMVARGGRRGEPYKVFALERPYGMKWSRIINFFRVLWLELKLRWRNFPRQVQQWFSKDWSFTEPPTRTGI